MKKFFHFLCISLLVAFVSQEINSTRVYVDMVADLFHAGHISFFEKARKFGDYLIVGLISDEVAANYKRLPILTLEERVKAVSACRYVNEVIADSPLCLTDEFLDEHQIDIVIHGDDYTPEQINLYYAPAVRRGIFRTVSYTPGISTTMILKRIGDRDNPRSN